MDPKRERERETTTTARRVKTTVEMQDKFHPWCGVLFVFGSLGGGWLLMLSPLTLNTTSLRTNPTLPHTTINMTQTHLILSINEARIAKSIEALDLVSQRRKRFRSGAKGRHISQYFGRRLREAYIIDGACAAAIGDRDGAAWAL